MLVGNDIIDKSMTQAIITQTFFFVASTFHVHILARGKFLEWVSHEVESDSSDNSSNDFLR